MNEDQAFGMFLGLAVGDAIGMTVEFKQRGISPEVQDIVGGRPFDLNAGQWTDDTSMALCLGESLVGPVDPDLSGCSSKGSEFG